MFALHFQSIVQRCRTHVAEIAALADGSAQRELRTILGVYRSVFEQSLLIDQGTKRPWNFLVSLGAELLAVSLAILIPLAYYDHLPAVHWKDIMVGPPPSAPPVEPQATHASNATSTTPAVRQHRAFVFEPKANPQTAATTSTDFAPDTPPALGVPDGVGGRISNTFLPNVVALPPPPPKPVEKRQPSAPVRVTSQLQMAMLLRKVTPAYPPLARSAGISGVVRLVGTIGRDGTIQNLQVVSGNPLLTQAALDAVRQWVYKPTLLNGVPVEVIAPIEVNFTLGR